jgi:PAS domain S-box-containing protein
MKNIFNRKSFAAQSPVLSIIYAFIAFIWLLISIEVVLRLFSQNHVFYSMEIAEDVMIAVLATGSLVYLYKRFHQTIARNEEQYKKLFTRNPHPMWIYDLTTLKFLKVNDAAVALYGYTEKEFLEMTINDIRLEDDVPALITRNDEDELRASENHYWSGIWRHKQKDENLIYVEISSHPLIFEGKKAELILSYDVTEKITKDLELQTMNQELEKKILERTNDLLYLNKTLIDQNKTIKSSNLELITVSNQLQEANRKIKEHSDLKNKFISMVSHEFRTPLASINFAAGFIKKYHHKIGPEVLLEKIANVEKQVAHMNELLNDVLTIGNSDSAKIQVNYQQLELNDFLAGIVQEVECANNNSHRIVFSTFGMIPNAIHTDEKLFRNIFINLLSNAIKYSPGDSHVEFNVYGGENEISFEVKDQGLGISQAEIDKIFEPFYRVSNGLSTDGTGLGLSIVKRATELIGAKIVVESELGKGSVFNVVLPLNVQVEV